MKNTILQCNLLLPSVVTLMICLTTDCFAAEFPVADSPVAAIAGAPEPSDRHTRQSSPDPVSDTVSVVTYALSGQDLNCLRSGDQCEHKESPANKLNLLSAETVAAINVASTRSVGVSTHEAGNQTGDIPEHYLELLKDIQDADYPDAVLFWRAIKARIALTGANNILRKKLFNRLEQRQSRQIDASLLKALSTEQSPAVIGQLATLQGHRFNDTSALEAAVGQQFIQLSERFEQYRSRVLMQAEKTHPFNIMPWNVSSCDCGHENMAGEVYGFFPYWLADEKHTLTFSEQSRIGYYGLSFDDQGNISHPERWRELDTKFIREARTHDNKVDLVIYRNNWESWQASGIRQKTSTFATLARNITDLLNIPLSDFASRSKPYYSLGLSAAPVMGDGITLYFEDYPQDRESVEAFGLFLARLRDMLQTKGRNHSLNIMFRSADMGRGLSDYPMLLGHLKHVEDKNLQMLYLVLLQEPTTHDKKLLRLNIENSLHGEQRQMLLRHVVPVLTFDGHNNDQLQDDIIYAKDNFGGIGFWPQADATSASTLSAALYTNYIASNKGRLKSFICKVACPNNRRNPSEGILSR